MKVIKKVVTEFQCEICGEQYTNRRYALECEKRPVEKPVCRKGDIATIYNEHFCFRGCLRYKIEKARIVKVSKPQLPDEEYERKRLGRKSKRLNSHVRQYEIEWVCPECKKKKRCLFYAPEFKVLIRS